MAAEEAKAEAHQQMSKTALSFFRWSCSLLVATSCGYTLAGRGGDAARAHPHHRHSPVHQPVAIRRTSTGSLTERVGEEFRGRGRYRVLPDTNGVDAVLTGTILNAVPMPTVVHGGQPPGVELRHGRDAQRRVQGREERQSASGPIPSLTVREEYEVPTGAGTDPAALFPAGFERRRAAGDEPSRRRSRRPSSKRCEPLPSLDLNALTQADRVEAARHRSTCSSARTCGSSSRRSTRSKRRSTRRIARLRSIVSTPPSAAAVRSTSRPPRACCRCWAIGAS